MSLEERQYEFWVVCECLQGSKRTMIEVCPRRIEEEFFPHCLAEGLPPRLPGLGPRRQRLISDHGDVSVMELSSEGRASMIHLGEAYLATYIYSLAIS
jgi:hypothetical protein